MKNEILKNAGLLNEEKTPSPYVIYKKGLKDPSKDNFDRLLELDTSGEFIKKAGEKWTEFDYKRGLDELIKKDKTGTLVFLAGDNWKDVDRKKALGFLSKKNIFLYKQAKKNWK